MVSTENMTDKKEIIDNEKDKYTMSQFLEFQLNYVNNKGELDISSGYFNISGYDLLRSSLWNFSKRPNFKLRLLFGREAIKRGDFKRL